eukprot:TRINITY_DN843_c0_g1_i1.p1 TRINITY_DN843_c0_g1~~TRINITY_DN843_c0_g1_i1.p1  ORF type:complete len:304 (-),score=91.14 TRINITY_DN843_c0_g1_i1:7-918(-)
MESEERSIFCDREEYDDDDGHFPISDYFDSQDAIAAGNYGAKGRKITLHINKPEHLEVVILKSDVAIISIPELELEEAPGTGRFISVRDLLLEMNGKLQQSAGYFSGPAAVKFNTLFSNMLKMIQGQEAFTLIIDDALSNSFIKQGTEEDVKIDVELYERTWETNKEFDLLVPIPYEENHLEYQDAIKTFADYVKKASKIAAFTGAGISVESGVPAYRATDQKSDIWTKYKPSDGEYANFIRDEQSRERYWEMKTEFYNILQTVSPNPGHTFFGYLHQQNKLLSIVTQVLFKNSNSPDLFLEH